MAESGLGQGTLDSLLLRVSRGLLESVLLGGQQFSQDNGVVSGTRIECKMPATLGPPKE